MSSSTDSPSFDISASRTSLRTATRSLSVVSLVLFVVFIAATAGALLPLQLLDPRWQLRVTAGLVNAAAVPLVGLALLQLAAALSPEDAVLKRRLRGCSRLAVLVVAGFLLLVPLHTAAGLRQNRASSTTQTARFREAETKLVELRQAVSGAGSPAELNEKLKRLQGPVLGPAALNQPLPVLKAELGAVLDRATQQLTQQSRRAAPPNPWLLLPELVRQGVACIALAIGFAALAQRRHQSISLLQEWQQLAQQWTERQRIRRVKAKRRRQRQTG
jgi:hypothetical protein